MRPAFSRTCLFLFHVKQHLWFHLSSCVCEQGERADADLGLYSSRFSFHVRIHSEFPLRTLQVPGSEESFYFMKLFFVWPYREMFPLGVSLFFSCKVGCLYLVLPLNIQISGCALLSYSHHSFWCSYSAFGYVKSKQRKLKHFTNLRIPRKPHIACFTQRFRNRVSSVSR